MSDLVLKSPLLTALNFKYSQDSVIRFIGKRNVTFFECHGVTPEKLIELINLSIQKSDEIFHVSYNSYKASGTLYITPEKLCFKPYWFNLPDEIDLSRGSSETSYLTCPLNANAINTVEEAIVEFETFKSHLIMVAILTEYSPNPWTKPKAKINSLADCILNLQTNGFEHKTVGEYSPPTGSKWTSIAKSLQKIAGSNATDSQAISNLIIKARREFSQHVCTLKSDNEFETTYYVIKACAANGSVIHEDNLPASFNVRDLDKLFEQNMEYYKHVLYFEVYDPFLDDSYIYHPKLIYILDDETKPKPMFLSFPSSFLNWLNTISSGSLRSRNSIIRQAIHNFVLNWKDQWNALSDKQKVAVKAAFVTLNDRFENSNGSEQSADSNSNSKVRRGRGRPRSKVEDNSGEPSVRGRPRIRPILTDEEAKVKSERGRGRPRKSAEEKAETKRIRNELQKEARKIAAQQRKDNKIAAHNDAKKLLAKEKVSKKSVVQEDSNKEAESTPVTKAKRTRSSTKTKPNTEGEV
jgi:hypothetical protein